VELEGGGDAVADFAGEQDFALFVGVEGVAGEVAADGAVVDELGQTLGREAGGFAGLFKR